MGRRTCIFIYYKNKFYASQTYRWDGYIDGQGAYIFKFLASSHRITALKRGLEHTTYISESQANTARNKIHNINTKSLKAKVRSWESFCSEYTSNTPRDLDKIHKYIDACSGPAILKLISAATARDKVTLVHPAFLSTTEARGKLRFVHPAFCSESNTHHINVDDPDIDEFDIRDLGIEKLGIDDIIMNDLDICDFNITDYEYNYMIDLDRSMLKVYKNTATPVCKYTFAELEIFSEEQFIRRYYEEVNYKEDLDSIPKYRLMLAGSIYPATHKEKASERDGKFEFCSTFQEHPTYLVCTQREYRKRKRIKNIIRKAKQHRIPICDYKSLDDEEVTLLWHPRDSKC